MQIGLYTGEVESVGRLLTLLDQHPRLVRLNSNGNRTENQPAELAAYHILDRDKWIGDPAELTVESLRTATGNVAFFESEKENGAPVLFLSGDQGPALDEARQLINSLGDGLIKWSTEGPQPAVVGRMPNEIRALRKNWHVPEELPRLVARNMAQQIRDQVVHQIWPNLPLKGLNGRTPKDELVAACATGGRSIDAAQQFDDHADASSACRSTDR
jgi:hypothetical protein